MAQCKALLRLKVCLFTQASHTCGTSGSCSGGLASGSGTAGCSTNGTGGSGAAGSSISSTGGSGAAVGSPVRRHPAYEQPG